MARGEPAGEPGLPSGHPVAARLAAVRRRIEAAGGSPHTVRVLAVTKGFGPEAVAAAVAAGLHDVGENYAQELVAKAAALAPPVAAAVRWHYLGAVQRNKVRSLAPLVACWQSVARAVEGREIARHRPGAAVLVEVDASGVPGRTGCGAHEAPALVRDLVALGLDVRGLMTVAPRGPGARAAFRVVRDLADRLDLAERSMGMTDDLEDAVAEGSTMVRV
ncbi:MAG: YggS family pyridoxal phosphate-dependent enzyme, partial [Acidimicrobiales bacterium]